MGFNLKRCNAGKAGIAAASPILRKTIMQQVACQCQVTGSYFKIHWPRRSWQPYQSQRFASFQIKFTGCLEKCKWPAGPLRSADVTYLLVGRAWVDVGDRKRVNDRVKPHDFFRGSSRAQRAHFLRFPGIVHSISATFRPFQALRVTSKPKTSALCRRSLAPQRCWFSSFPPEGRRARRLAELSRTTPIDSGRL